MKLRRNAPCWFGHNSVLVDQMIPGPLSAEKLFDKNAGSFFSDNL